MVLSLPNDKYTKQLRDMCLHWFDLMDAKATLEAMKRSNPAEINRSLGRDAIVTFYKCFGKNKSRSYSLSRDKVLSGYPADAKKVFDYYHNLRNKFIAHDESRYSQVFTGVILDSSKDPPFVDIVNSVTVADKFNSEYDWKGLSSLYRLILASIKWVENKIDELIHIISNEYSNKRMVEFKDFKPLTYTVPRNEDVFSSRK